MMPKPTDSEKKICPNAAAHTDVCVSADQFGENSALRPWAAPGRNSARTTSAANATISSGMNTTAVAPIPFCTPSAMITSTATHTIASGTSTPITTDALTPGSPACRKSPNRNVSGSSPQDLSTEKNVYRSAQAMTAA